MRLSLSPARVVVAPGDVVELEVAVLNDGDRELLPVLRVRGVDPAQVLHVDAGVELSPGAQGIARVAIAVPPGAAAGSLPLAIEVEDADGLHEATVASADVTVGERPPVTVELDPPSLRGRRGGRLTTILHNHGATPLDLELSGGGEDVDVEFRPAAVTVPPGASFRVRTRLRATTRPWWREVRHGLLVHVGSTGAPVSTPASFVQRPVVPPLIWRITAVVAIVALWAGALVALNDRVLNPSTEDVAASEQSTDDATDGASDGDGEDGEDGDGEADGADGEDAALGPPVVVQGEVTGPPDPAGTDVVIERVSFGDPGTTSAEGVKLAALTSVTLPRAQVVERIQTATDERGRFRFGSGLATSAYYRVTALRTGYEVASQVVQTEAEPTDHDVEILLDSAPGGMAGRVTDTDGDPIGGADVVVTGGELTYRATTATEGAVGTWSIEGMAALPAYVVSVREPRHATASIVRSLEGGVRLTDVDVQLVPNLGTVRGRVFFRGEGVEEAITVSLTGDVERTTSTLTDEGVEGFFELPALPFGTYTLTFSGDGWVTQTREVVVDRGDVEVNNDLVPATAAIQGIVVQEVVSADCVYPDASERDAVQIHPCGGVAVSLTGQNGTFRTTSATADGRFDLTSIPPGIYTVTFERTGYVTQFLTIELGQGDIVTLSGEDTSTTGGTTARVDTTAGPRPEDVPPIIMRLVPPVTAAVGELRAVLRSAAAPSDTFAPPAGTQLVIDGQPEAVVEALGDGAYQVTNVVPGAQTVRVTSPGYDDFARVLRIRADGPTDGGELPLVPLATLALRVTDGSESPIPGAEVFVTGGDDESATRLDASTDETVRACTVGRDGAGRWRLDVDGTEQLVGLCTTVTDAGDASLRQALGTGGYRIITPVNGSDLAEDDSTPEAREVRAGTVPLDHAQLDRQVDVQSGETSRLDLRARRYPVITGRVRLQSGNGFTNATRDGFTVGDVDGLAAFPEFADYVNETSGEPGEIGIELIQLVGDLPAEAPAGLRPRLSFGPPDGLPVGTYRINRVLPSEPDAAREYELGFADAERRAFDFDETDAITNLAFGEIRTTNVVLVPPPVPVDVRVLRERARDFVAVAFPTLTVRGTVAFDGDTQTPVTDEVTWEAGETGAGLVRDEDGEVVRFLAGEPVFFDITAEGFEDIDDEERELAADAVIDLVMTPLRRDVRGTVRLEPVAASTDSELAKVNLSLEPEAAEDEDEPSSLGYEQTIADGVLSFTFIDVLPGQYRLLASGTDLFDFDSGILDVPPGPSDVPADIGPDGAAANPPPFLVDRVVGLDVTVTEQFDGGAPTAVEDVEVTLRLLGTTIPPENTDGAGVASFDGLRGGPAREYLVVLDGDGYRDPTPGDNRVTIDEIADSAAFELVRFGAVTARIRSELTADDVDDLAGATGELLTPAGEATGFEATSASDGVLTFDAEQEIPAGAYRLRVTADGHDPRTVDVTVTDARVTDAGTISLLRTRAAASGVVRDGPGGDGLPFVRVRALDVDDRTIVRAETVTGDDGTYRLDDIPPETVVLQYAEFSDARLTVPTSQRIHEREQTFDEGDRSALPDVELLRDLDAISGTVRSLAFPGADPTRLGGAQVAITCTAGSPQPPDECTDGATDQEETGSSGTYGFDVLPVGPYDVDVSAAGHDDEDATSVVVVRYGPDDDDTTKVVADGTLTATPLQVPVTATSAGGGGESLDVSVRATYLKDDPSDPDPPTGSPYVYGDRTTDGTADLVLPPGRWRIETTDATDASLSPRPHADASTEIRLTAGVTPPPVGLQLDPYVAVTGAVRSRTHVGASDTALVGATLTPAPPRAGLDTPYGDTSASDGAFRVLLPPTDGADVTWTVALAAEDHAGGDLSITLAEDDGDVALGSPPPDGVTVSSDDPDLPVALVPGGVVLTANPIDVPVQVTSRSDDGGLADVTVTATWNGSDPAPSGSVYDVDDTTDSGGLAQVVLAPGPWRLTTSGADTGAGLPDQPPHQNRSDVTIALDVGAAVDDPDQPLATEVIDLLRYASVTGTVVTQDSPTSTKDPAGNVAIGVVSPTTGFPETPSSADGVTGRWRVWVPDPATTTVRFTLSGYVVPDLVIDEATFGSRDVPGGEVVMTGVQRTVRLTVVSAFGSNAALQGIVVTATDPGDPSITRTSAPSNANGVAVFSGANSLHPTTWRFTTADGPTLLERGRGDPHKDVVAADNETRKVNAGPPTQAFELKNNSQRLELTRYALVSGTVETRDFAGETSSPRGGVTVSASGVAGVIPVTPSADDGSWKVWRPDPRTGPVDITFSLADHGTETITPEQAAEPERDYPEPDPVILTATPRPVLIDVTDPGGTKLAGVTVTATRVGADPAVTRTSTVTTATTGASFTGGEALAPGTWEFTTTGGPALTPPHNDVVDADDERRTIAVGSGTVSFTDPSTGTEPRLELTPYASITGTVTTRAYTAGPRTPSNTATVATTAAGAIVTQPDADGNWLVRIPSPTDATVRLSQTGYTTRSVTVDEGDFDATTLVAATGTTALTAVARVVEVDVTSDLDGPDADTDPDPLGGITVTATWTGTEPTPPAPVTAAATEADDGRAELTLAPGTWRLTTTGGPALGPEERPHEDVVDADAQDRTVPLATTDPATTLTATGLVLDSYTRVIGITRVPPLATVPPDPDPDPEPQAGVDVTTTDPAQAVTPTGDGGAFTGWMPAGNGATFDFVFTRDVGAPPVTVVEQRYCATITRTDAEAEADGVVGNIDLTMAACPDPPAAAASSPPAAQSSMSSSTSSAPAPAPTGATLTGVVTRADGSAIDGAVVTARRGDDITTATTDATGTYALAGLDPDATTAITFTPPSGVPGVAVTRWVAPGGATDVTIPLDQEVPASLGNLAVAVTGGVPGDAVEVVLRETNPFPTLSAEGTLTRSGVLDTTGATTIVFEDLVPGDDVSVPQDRLRIDVTSPSAVPFTRDGLEVVSGATTVVDVGLSLLTPPTREVVLTLADPFGPVTAASTTLEQDGVRLVATNVAGTDTYTFADVEAGPWTLQVAGYDDVTLAVPVGDGPWTPDTVVLAPAPRDVALTLRDAAGNLVTAPAAALVRDTEVVEVSETRGTVIIFADVSPGSWTVTNAEGYDDAALEVTPGVGTLSLELVLTATARSVDLVVQGPDGSPIAGATPELIRDGVERTSTLNLDGSHRFTDVAVGTWTVTGVDGHDDGTVDVAVGDGVLVATVVLQETTPVVVPPTVP